MKTILVSRSDPNHTATPTLSVVTRLSLAFTMAIAVFACGNNQTAQPRNYPDEGTPQAQIYMEKCGQCHAAPLPSAHTAKIWPSVLQRMQLRMKTKHVPPLTRKEMSIILGYVQQHAKPSADKP